MSVRKEQPGRYSRYMLFRVQLSVALQHNNRVSMGVVQPRLRYNEQLCLLPVLQCKQWSVRHSICAAACSFFCRKFRVMSLFTLGTVLNEP